MTTEGATALEMPREVLRRPPASAPPSDAILPSVGIELDEHYLALAMKSVLWSPASMADDGDAAELALRRPR